MKNMTLGLLVICVWSITEARADYQVTAPPAEANLPSFYAKYVSASGFPVVSSKVVNDYALKEAAYLIDLMLAKRPDVRKAMIESGSRLIVMAYNEYSTDIPEYAHMKPKDFWDRRARGFGGSKTDPVCSCGEENLLGYAGDPYEKENILIHEFAHNIHLRGMTTVDPTFDGRVKKAYDDAMAKELWKGKYASTNHHEYFAEGVQSWFDNNRPPDHDHNHVDTRKELLEYDPALAALCEEIFGDTPLAYTKPVTRLKDHLAGYDPAGAPVFAWPERLVAAHKAVREQVAQRIAQASEEPKASVWAKHEIKSLEGWQVHVDTRLLGGEHAELGRLAMRILSDKLHRITMIMPPDKLEKLREVPIFLDHNHVLKSMQYHPAVDWLKSNGHDPAMEKAVHIPRAQGLIDHERDQIQPWVVLHELAHAYHDRVLGFDHAPIRQAWEKAMEAGIYKKALHMRGHQTQHYATTNHKEYFAEITEAYFGTNDFYPFVRPELKSHDPEGFAVLESIWGKRAGSR